jgi:hypothetical protein
MSIVNLPVDMWDRGSFFALATVIGQPARSVVSISNSLRGCQPKTANPAELAELERIADALKGAEMTLRRIVADLSAKPVLMIAAE